MFICRFKLFSRRQQEGFDAIVFFSSEKREFYILRGVHYHLLNLFSNHFDGLSMELFETV